MNLYLIHETGKRNTVGSLIVRAETEADALAITKPHFSDRDAVKNERITVRRLISKGLPGILHTFNY